MTDSELLARLQHIERRIAELTSRVYVLERARATQPEPAEAPGQREQGREEAPPATPAMAAPPVQPAPPPPIEPVMPPPPIFASAPPPALMRSEAPPPRSSAEWEALLGGNWLNKIGAFVLVVGIALALGYSFAHMGPGGRDAVGLAGSLAMLGAGVWFERRPRYQTFARGLIGGGWAALYFTVYAMQALAAAKIIQSPIAGAVLLILVAAGMIAHALRYRSEAVVGVAYFSAFVALAITEVTSFSVVALVPLAASLLYLAHRFQWSKLALFGVIATYVTCASRGDTGAPLWTAQTIFAIYWLLFEGFDILDPGRWVMPLNAFGFLSLSLFKWGSAEPADIWVFLSAAAAAYVASGVLRARMHPDAAPFAGGWHGPATLTAALGASAILDHLSHQWLLLALLAEAEAFYLAGVRFRARYLRILAAPLFALEIIHLTAEEVPTLGVSSWTPVAALTAAVFYANRALRTADVFYGYAAAAVAALIAGYESPAHEPGRGLFLLAAGPFFFGWWRRLADFRCQGYFLACVAALATALTAPHPPLSTGIGAAVSYAFAAFALWSPGDRFPVKERDALFDVASTAGAVGVAIVLRALLLPAAVGPAWAVEALLLVCAALLIEKRAFRWQAYALAAVALAQCWAVNLWRQDAALAVAAAAACFYAAQLLNPRGSDQRLYYSLLASVLTAGMLYYEVSGSVLTIAWGVEGLALLAAGFPLRDRFLRLSGLALLLFCILKLFIYDLSYLDTLPRIFSFIALGLILVGVSWIYTRFRERVQKYL